MGTKKKMSLGLEWQDRGILSEKDQSKNGPRTNTKSKKQIQKTKTKQKKNGISYSAVLSNACRELLYILW